MHAYRQTVAEENRERIDAKRQLRQSRLQSRLNRATAISREAELRALSKQRSIEQRMLRADAHREAHVETIKMKAVSENASAYPVVAEDGRRSCINGAGDGGAPWPSTA